MVAPNDGAGLLVVLQLVRVPACLSLARANQDVNSIFERLAEHSQATAQTASMQVMEEAKSRMQQPAECLTSALALNSSEKFSD